MARLEARLLFETLLRRFDEIELVDPKPRWKPLLFFRALESLPIRVRGA